MKIDFQPRRLAFISSNTVPWGGSEELWSATATRLAEAGHSVRVFKGRIDETQPRIRRLKELSCPMHDLIRIPGLPRKLSSLIAKVAYPIVSAQQIARLALGLKLSKPDLAVVSQGGNHDGLLVADICRRLHVPYILIAQKAAEIYWPPDTRLPRLRAVYAAARACLFVSQHNRQLTEEQLGMRLPHALIVRNPFLVPWERRDDWPEDDGTIRLACVGRLYPAEKGQDLLIRVLARDHWRERKLAVTFYGDGPHREALERMALHLGVTSVRFAGFVADVASIWSTNHGLVVPSRCEGLPLVLVEGMLSGRVPIATAIAGHPEVIHNDQTGFLASTASEDALDETLDRAWQRRDEWRAIGSAAADRIRTLVPRDPAGVAAEQILKFAAAAHDVRVVRAESPASSER